MSDAGNERQEAIAVVPLEEGQERLWVQVKPLQEVLELGKTDALKYIFQKLREDLWSQDPRCFLIALKGGKCVGRVHGLFPDPGIYMLREMISAPDEEFEPVGKAFCAYLVSSFSRDGTQLLLWDAPATAPVQRILEEAGFEISHRKIFVERNIHGYTSPYRDPFTYKTLPEVGETAFLEMLSACAEGDPFEEDIVNNPEKGFGEFVAYAGDAFDPSWWRIAYLGEEPVGVILPQVYAGGEAVGSIFYIGVHPRFRGRGYGKILHAEALTFMADNEVTKYEGTTEARNAPMIRIFRRNGCRQTGVQLFFKVSALPEPA